MIQQTIPIQPGETVVTASLRRFAADQGFCVRYTTNGSHDPDGYHPLGQAADLVDFAGPEQNSPFLLHINETCWYLIPHRYIAELIYGGPGAICVRNGAIYRYSAELMRAHENHVHLAVTADFIYSGGTHMAAPAPVVGVAVTADGKGYVIVTASGAAYCFGEAEYHGGLQPNPTTGSYDVVGAR